MTRVQFLAGAGIFLFATTSRPPRGPTQPPTQHVTGALFLAVKQLVCEGDHSPPSGAEVKNVWSYNSTPPYIFKAWCLIKHQDFTYLTLHYTFT
jgi:hypothetical protein